MSHQTRITHLTSASRKDVIEVPALHQLCVSMNRLQALPNIGSWTSLVTLSADENSINSIPEGLPNLASLRHVDFSSNDIRVIPPEIGLLENLAMLRLSGNPLRTKKFCTATTEELKATLVGRLEPALVQHDPEPATNIHPVDGGTRTDSASRPALRGDALSPREDNSDRSDMDDFATPPTSAPHSPARSRAHTAPAKHGRLNPEVYWTGQARSLLRFIQSSALRSQLTTPSGDIYLQRNLFTALPDSLSFFAASLTTLSPS